LQSCTNKREELKNKTTPLDVETINVLCKNFEMDENHNLCNHKGDVYSFDFAIIILNTFQSGEKNNDIYQLQDGTLVTIDVIEKKIGSYKTYCEPLSYIASSDSKYYVCYYDLRGDGAFDIGVFYYHPENTVFRITFSGGED
jgi:hypothetical protein